MESGRQRFLSALFAMYDNRIEMTMVLLLWDPRMFTRGDVRLRGRMHGFVGVLHVRWGGLQGCFAVLPCRIVCS